MKKFNLLFFCAFVLFISSSVYAQYNITVNITEVSVTGFCDLDGIGSSDPYWEATVDDNRDQNQQGDHAIDGNNGPSITVTSGFDDGEVFNHTYDLNADAVAGTQVCPPNYITLSWLAREDDTIGGDAESGTTTLILEIVDPVTGTALAPGTYTSIGGVNLVGQTASVSECGGTVTWGIDFEVVISGSPHYVCADQSCASSTQTIQDPCDTQLNYFSYDVSNSVSDISGGSTACGFDADNDIFFEIVAPTSGTFTIYVDDWGDFGAATQANLTGNLYEGGCSSLGIVTAPETVVGTGAAQTPDCIDFSSGILNTTNEGPFTIENLTPGQSYWLRVTEEDDQPAWVSLAFAESLIEDDCLNAQPLTGIGCNYNGTDADEPDTGSWTGSAHTAPYQTCAGWSSNENMVWYYFDIDNNTPQPITITVNNVNCDNTGGGTLQLGVWQDNGGGCAPTGSATASNGLGGMTGVGCDVGTGTVSVSLPNGMPNGRYYVVADGNAGANCIWEFESAQLLSPCPTSDFSAGVTEALCDGDTPTLPVAGTDYTITDDDGTQLGGVTWYVGTDPDNDATYTATATAHSGADNCTADAAVTVYAYVQCDSDLSGVFGDVPEDVWVQVASHTFQVYPEVQMPMMVTNGCAVTLTAQCSDVLGAASNATGDANTANYNSGTGVYTAQAGDAAAAFDIAVTSGIAGNPCMSSPAIFTINTPACAAGATCDLSDIQIDTSTPACNNDGTYTVTLTATGGPDASVSYTDSNAIIGGTLPSAVAGAVTTFTYNIGTNANIIVNDSESLCSFGPFVATSPVADTGVNYLEVDGDCNNPPVITLPSGYTCTYEFLTGGTFAGTTGSGATATYPAAIVDGDSGTVRFTITTLCGLTETVDVNFICVSCSADIGTWN